MPTAYIAIVTEDGSTITMKDGDAPEQIVYTLPAGCDPIEIDRVEDWIESYAFFRPSWVLTKGGRLGTHLRAELELDGFGL